MLITFQHIIVRMRIQLQVILVLAHLKIIQIGKYICLLLTFSKRTLSCFLKLVNAGR